MLRQTVIGIIIILLIGGFGIQNSFGHTPDFEVSATEDILKFCEFFYYEYELVGIDFLVNQHPQFPNIRACSILYNHIAWNSSHELRDFVLIKEIEKYLGNSDDIKERHLREFTTIPDWIKKDAQMWVDGKSKDSQFAYGIRIMLKNNVLSPAIIDNMNNRVCTEEGLCIKETDYVTYSHTSKFGNTITEKFEIESIDSMGILINTKIISEESIETKQFYLDESVKIPDEEKCCETKKFLYKIPITIGQIIENGYQIIGTTSFPIEGLIRTGLIAQNLDKTKLLVIDKETGILLSEKFEKTVITTYWEKTSLIKTNIFQESVGIQFHDLKIPEWWKKTTSWWLEGKISNLEYIQAMENLISRNILRV
ncbi:MAG: hypothetical protein MJK05_10245 [Nitrosopumilus sp.]|nr:hypothetical protein [Nitrosopumilus sp.]